MRKKGISTVLLTMFCIGLIAGLACATEAKDNGKCPACKSTPPKLTAEAQKEYDAWKALLTPSVECGCSVMNATTRPLSELIASTPKHPKPSVTTEVPLGRAREASEGPGKGAPGAEPAAETPANEYMVTRPTPVQAMPPAIHWPGLTNLDGLVPPDTNGDVGPNDYFQIVNSSFQIFAKDGTPRMPPRDISNIIFSGLPTSLCYQFSLVDPVVLYDEAADRWLVSGFPYRNPPLPPPYHQCIAVSQGPDPRGSWYDYDFVVHATLKNDYGKFGVWPVKFTHAPRGAYFMSTNLVQGITIQHIGAYAFDRNKMLDGLPAPLFLRFEYSAFPVSRPDVAYALPADLDGPWIPAHDTPETFVNMVDFQNTDYMMLVHFTPDFDTPGAVISYPFGINVAPYDTLCPPPASLCIHEQGGDDLDSLGEATMYRAAYRWWGDSDSLVFNHSIDLDPSPSSVHGGIRWYEVRNVHTGFPYIYQSGTYVPDEHNRWMGSAAQDQNGDIAVGYSVSSGAMHPAIRYVGRLSSDPLGQMPYTEATMRQGLASQVGSGRWGDYSMMAVDPSDGCKFWYTNEFYDTAGINWQTEFGYFKFAECGGDIQLGGNPLIEDGCDMTGNALIDWDELINMFVPLCSTNGAKSGVEGTLSSPDLLVQIGGFSPETQDPNCHAPKTQISVYGDVGPCPTSTYTRFTFMVSSARSNDPIPFKLDLTNFQGSQGTILFSVPMNPNTLTGGGRNPTPPDAGTIYAVHNFPSGECSDGKGILWYWERQNCSYPGCQLNCPYYADHWNYYTGWLATLQRYGIYTHVADYRTGDCHAPCNAGRWDPLSSMCQFLDCYADSDPNDYYFLISGEYACMPDGRGAEGTLGYDGSFPNPPTERPYGGGNCHY